ncbi:DNA alkylation repair protein [Candidatus Kaiserbacteria bacterium]|nr:DNA alkylation repair protein [Candidatus Kaiserbacteria bacterium]USN91953.1 MAG: DNA alkylation repair protein [Candidatus Nomurabacteria bacterium]
MTINENDISLSAVESVKSELQTKACSQHASALSRYFKTGPGQYGEGDIFIGVRMPDIRKVASTHRKLSLTEVILLLKSTIHDERLCALVILTEQFIVSTERGKKQIYDAYLSHTTHINNWDLVDISAHKIVGAYLHEAPKSYAEETLQCLANSDDIWERRIAIIATAYFIQRDRFNETINTAKVLLNDDHDLIHKAVGWMLREVGKRDQDVEMKFLRRHYKQMPRTMLRYAIEKFPEKIRRRFLKGEI